MSTVVTNLIDPPRQDVGRSPERPRVLIAEDDRDLRELLEEVFREDGWAVHSAPNGTKLLDELSQAILESDQLVPDLVLTGIMMPGVQVMSVLAELRAAGWTTPVIVVSARADEISHEIGRTLDPIVFCQKPVDLDRLLQLAHTERRQRTPQPPIYRGAHPSTARVIEERPRPIESTRVARAPDRAVRTLTTLLRRRPILHVTTADASATRGVIDALAATWEVRAHADGSSFLSALGRDLRHGDPPDVVVLDPLLEGLDEIATSHELVHSGFAVPVVLSGDNATMAKNLRASGVRAFVARRHDALEETLYEAIVDALTRPRSSTR
jgi:DNA-binding response OmpR family regulator